MTENLSPEGRLTFRLPIDTPRIGLDIGEGVQEPDVVLHTVMIDMDEAQVDLVWRGAVPYPRTGLAAADAQDGRAGCMRRGDARCA